MTKGIRKKAAANKAGGSPVFVDLSDVEMASETQTVMVRVIEVHSKEGILRMKENAAKGYMMIFDLSHFEGNAEDLKDAGKAIRSLTSETNTTHYRINDNVSVLVQPGTRVEKVKVVRKDGNGR